MGDEGMLKDGWRPLESEVLLHSPATDQLGLLSRNKKVKHFQQNWNFAV